jgi:2-polyprenyl-3-methyl-5-hydroxy-6-metoxy-1,4-benzoquinol methylase
MKIISHSHCPMCASSGVLVRRKLQDRLFHIASGDFSHAMCSEVECRTVWLDPIPSRMEIHSFYAGEYYTHENDQKITGGFERVFRRFSNFILGRESDQDQDLGLGALGVPIGSRVADIGCGNGELLTKLRLSGYSTVGIEPDLDAAAVASALGHQIHVGLLTDLLPGISERFDAIVSTHVIEHSADPKEFLEGVFELAGSGGAIHVRLPNPESIGARILGRHWMPWDVPRHVVLPTQQALRVYLESVRPGTVVSSSYTSSAGVWINSFRMALGSKKPMARGNSKLARAALACLFLGLTVVVRLLKTIAPLSGDETTIMASALP